MNEALNLLVVGGGAREHALVSALRDDPDVGRVVCAPGNAGIAREPGVRTAPVDTSDPERILALAESEGVHLTVIGPEQPLADGAADVFAEAGRLLFGPSRAAARLESSKGFAKAFMERRGIPTARFDVCADETSALDAVRGDRFGFPVVVKADGLAAGKGVTVAPDRATAEAAVRAAMIDRRFGAAGTTLVIEECLTGPEVSCFVICDGRRGLTLPPAQDHKRAYDGDAGPNTGGMGALAPSPLVGPELASRIEQEIITPTIDGLREEGCEYRGVLYAGLMLTDDGPKVIEFNVRFGDPEAQVVLPMVKSGLARVLRAAAAGDLGDADWRLADSPHVGVVMASGGYPGSYRKGLPITGLAEAAARPDVRIFHAGTRMDEAGNIVTNGGRVLTVVGRGSHWKEAVDRAYDAAALIRFEGSHARTDIGRRVVAQEQERKEQHG
ncbi:MAG: phosphoribosylamine--glycine ligase [Acidobacteria bacterium]|nr:phosphoribosylamine--glycine ligase [Acidobacteriota bacterium]